jgi:hypothetical protein
VAIGSNAMLMAAMSVMFIGVFLCPAWKNRL